MKNESWKEKDSVFVTLPNTKACYSPLLTKEGCIKFLKNKDLNQDIWCVRIAQIKRSQSIDYERFKKVPEGGLEPPQPIKAKGF